MEIEQRSLHLFDLSGDRISGCRLCLCRGKDAVTLLPQRRDAGRDRVPLTARFDEALSEKVLCTGHAAISYVRVSTPFV